MEDSFAKSMLWGFAVAAESGGRVLVDATDFFLRDVYGAAARLRPGNYRVDRTRSAFYLPSTKGFPGNTEVEMSLTFVNEATGGGAGGNAAGPAQGPAPIGATGGGGGGFGGGLFSGSVGSVTPTTDSVTLREHMSFVELPDGNYKTRIEDPRAGYGGITFVDFSVPVAESIQFRFIRRHRLQKKDPTAAISEPVKPIVYCVDSGAPDDVKSALIEGAMWWNQAFEAAGFRNAFQVEVLPDGADPMDVRYNMINWVHRSTRGWSIGRIGHRPAHRRDHQGHRHARVAARSAGLPDRRGPALALRERHRAADGARRRGARAHPPALGARGRPHARPRPQLLRQQQGLDLGDGLPAPAREAEGRRHHRHLQGLRRR